MLRQIRKKIEMARKDEPFFLAVQGGDLTVIQSMVEEGCNVNAKNTCDCTVLELAGNMNRLDIVKYLHSKGAEIRTKDNDNRLALRIPVMAHYYDIITYYLDNGVDINAADNEGNTALIYSVNSSYNGKCLVNPDHNKEMAEFLIKKGADFTIKNNAGYDALSYAKQFSFTKSAIEMLEKYLGHQFSNFSFQSRLEKIGADKNIPEHLLCPISKHIMNDPVTISSNGMTYDRETLVVLFDKHKTDKVTCPITQAIIARRELSNKTNLLVYKLIERYTKKMEDTMEYVNSGKISITQAEGANENITKITIKHKYPSNVFDEQNKISKQATALVSSTENKTFTPQNK